MTTKSSFTLTRRTLLAGASAVLATPAILRPALAQTTLTLADPGGPFNSAFRKAFYDPFEKKLASRSSMSPVKRSRQRSSSRLLKQKLHMGFEYPNAFST